MGRRSRRAPALTLIRESLFLAESGEGALREGFEREAAVLLEGVALRGEEEFLAAACGAGVELENAGDKGVGFLRELFGGTNLRDEADFEGLVGSKRLSEENQWKSEARERVFPEIGHDGGGRKAVAHFGETEGGTFGDKSEVADDGQAHAEAEGVAVYFGDGDERASAQNSLELDDASDFRADGVGVASGTLAAGAEDGAASTNAEDAGAGLCGFGTKLGEHSVKHRAGDFVAEAGIVEREGQDARGAGFRRVGFGKRTWRADYTGYQ